MNGYELSRHWFDFAFENPDIVNVTQAALYMWLIEANNRAGFSEKFAFNTEDACRAIGVSNRKTVWKALNELADIGFVRIVIKSSNQNRPSVLSLKVGKKNTAGALDKVLISQSKIRTSAETAHGQAEEQQTDNQSNSAETAHGHSYKQQTINLKPQTSKAQNDTLRESFDRFWNAYDKKTDRVKCERAWKNLTNAKRELALANVAYYVKANPDKKYRKNPLTYLNGECWNDELPTTKQQITLYEPIRQKPLTQQEQNKLLGWKDEPEEVYTPAFQLRQ